MCNTIIVYPAGKPENFRSCVAEGSKKKKYDFTLRRLDSEALRLLQRLVIRHAGEKRGFYVILISRLLPFISFDIISYMAGLSGIRLWAFISGSALGMLPATLVHTYIGHEFPAMEKNFPILLTYTTVFIFILVVFSLVQGSRKKN